MVKVKLITDGGVHVDILPETTTVQETYDKFGVNYLHTTNTINSEPIQPRDMNRTLGEFAVDDQVRMSSVVKEDNGAEAIIAGSAMIMKSGVKLEDWQKVLKYAPDFGLYDEDDDELIFKAMVGEGCGSVNDVGILFSDQATDDGYACATVCLNGIEDKKMFVEEEFGHALLNLIELENEIPAMLEEAEKAHKEISEKIHVI